MALQVMLLFMCYYDVNIYNICMWQQQQARSQTFVCVCVGEGGGGGHFLQIVDLFIITH